MSDMREWTQLSLGGLDDRVHQIGPPVYAFDPTRRTNGERIADLHRLGYLVEPVLDPTYGRGGMWKRVRPERLICGDINPRFDGVLNIDFTDLPFPTQSFGSCVYDPPYKLGGGRSYDRKASPGHVDLEDRFGVDIGRRWKGGVKALIADGLLEMARVTTDFVIYKTQDMINVTRFQNQTYEATELMRELGWELVDRLHLTVTVGQPEGTVQKHVWNNYSTFLVFGRG